MHQMEEVKLTARTEQRCHNVATTTFNGKTWSHYEHSGTEQALKQPGLIIK